jgi:uncharacterized protein
MDGTGAPELSRPVPIVQPDTIAYWEGARQRRLVLQRCSVCSTWIHPPRFACPACQSAQIAPAQASGFGSVFSWSVMHQRGVPGFDELIPYAVVLIELDEQPGLLAVGHVIDCPPADLFVGLAVEVCFEERDHVVLPQWRRRR